MRHVGRAPRGARIGTALTRTSGLKKPHVGFSSGVRIRTHRNREVLRPTWDFAAHSGARAPRSVAPAGAFPGGPASPGMPEDPFLEMVNLPPARGDPAAPRGPGKAPLGSRVMSQPHVGLRHAGPLGAPCHSGRAGVPAIPSGFASTSRGARAPSHDQVPRGTQTSRAPMCPDADTPDREKPHVGFLNSEILVSDDAVLTGRFLSFRQCRRRCHSVRLRRRLHAAHVRRSTDQVPRGT